MLQHNGNDFRPLHDMYIPKTEGIVIWTEEGDIFIFMPKEEYGDIAQ